MKDLVLTDAGGTFLASFRCEKMDNNPSVFEPIEIRNNQGKIVDSIVIAENIWQRLPYNWIDIIAFAQAHNYNLQSSDSNGNNPVILVSSVGGE